MNIENPFVHCGHPLIDFLQKLVDTPIYPEMKEYVKIVHIKIEDETHFLTRCPKFSGERDDLFNSRESCLNCQ
jgi:hypothetical protein